LVTNPALIFFGIFLSIVLSYVVPVLILFLISVKKTPSSESDAQMQQQAINDIKNKYAKYWYVLDIILISFILFWGALSDPFGWIIYSHGLKNDYMAIGLGFGYYMLTVPAILSILVLIIRMIVSWPKFIVGRFRLFSIISIVIVCLSAYLALPFLPITRSHRRSYIDGFEGYVKKNADIDEIRNWLNSFTREEFIEYEKRTKNNYKGIEKQDRPDAISQLKPKAVVVSWDGDYKPKVELSWGGGITGLWGFVVLNENKSDSEFGLSTSLNYRSELKNGVYIWSESH
jgi:hypothetical protein